MKIVVKYRIGIYKYKNSMNPGFLDSSHFSPSNHSIQKVTCFAIILFSKKNALGVKLKIYSTMSVN